MEQINEIKLNIDAAKLIVGVKAATTALRGLDSVLSSIAEGVKEAFAVKGYEDYKDAVKRFGKDLADELLELQTAFGKMKVAIAQAVSPIAEVFVPMINDAIYAVIRFASVVRQFLTAFISGISGNTAVADAAQEAAVSQNRMAKAAKVAGKAARRSLMSFDELNRLNAASGSGGSAVEDVIPIPEELTIAPWIQELANKLLQLLEPLRSIDLTPLASALERVKVALGGLAAVIGPNLEWLWYEILTPFAQWLAESLGPTLVNCFAAGLEKVAAAADPVLQGMQALWEGIKPIVEYIGTLVVQALDLWRESFELLAQVFREKGPQLVAVFQNVSRAVSLAWEAVSPVLEMMRLAFESTFSIASQAAADGAGVIIDALAGITEFMNSVFAGNWSNSWEQLRGTLKTVVNGVVDLLNALLSRLVSALNKVIGAANKLSFTVPSWVPGIGGKSFGVSMGYVSLPQIPYLAQGAVLPANRPFLAMVGDQRHGTNVEAPLETIQQAVAVVMEDMVSSNAAGHQATVEMLGRILEAVLGIRIGDDVIAGAVDRHRLRMAMMRGG